MAKTVAEVLKETGMTDEQISALDPKVVAGVTTILSTAQQTFEEAEKAKRMQNDQWEKDISPALDNWGNEKASYDSEKAALRAALKAAEEGGFKIPDILKTQAAAATAATTTRAADGKFVAGATGSPEFVKTLRDEVGGAFAFVADTSWKYRKLFGTEMPDSPTTVTSTGRPVLVARPRLSPSMACSLARPTKGMVRRAERGERRTHGGRRIALGRSLG